MARRETLGAAWRGASRPAKVVLEVEGLHARHMEAARQFGSQFGASWKKGEALARRGVGLGRFRDAWRHSNRRRGRPVGGENRRRRRCRGSGEAGGRG